MPGTRKFHDPDETTALLIRARGFLERGWCQGAAARNAEGESVSALSEDAVAWCAVGAMEVAGLPTIRGTLYDDINDTRRGKIKSGSPVVIPDKQHPAFRRLRTAIGGSHIAVFSDAQETVEPVLAAFDRAIKAES